MNSYYVSNNYVRINGVLSRMFTLEFCQIIQETLRYRTKYGKSFYRDNGMKMHKDFPKSDVVTRLGSELR